MTKLTRGERWFWRLVGLAAVIGAVGYFFWPWLPLAPFELSFAVLAFVIAAIVFFVRWRDRSRGFAARAARMERDTWLSTLPPPNEEAPRPEALGRNTADHDG